MDIPRERDATGARGGHNRGVERLRSELERLAARPDWPVVSGLALAMLGLLEAYVYSRAGAFEDDATTTYLLTLTATLPLVFRRTHL